MRRRATKRSLALRVLGIAILSGCAENLPAPAWQIEHGRAPEAAASFFAFPESAPLPVAPPAPPLSLTASDGTGLRVVEIEARAIVEEPLAFTELHLTFDNPEDRRLEGTFSITLPEGAALSRFSMKIGQDWQEGEVVEKQRAREAYEDFLHRRQDPALLEQAAGNAFSARVFPIPPRARKELIVSYSQELSPDHPYVLPLRGLPELGKLSLSVTLAGEPTPVAELTRTGEKPDDFRLDPRFLHGGPGLRSGELVVARVRPIPATEPDPFSSTILLVDTSASRALGFDEQVRLVARLSRRIAETAGARAPLAVVAFDQAADLIFEGEAGSFGEGDLRRLRDRQAFGASSLESALDGAEERARARGYKRVIVVGDGVATAGDVEPASLAARAAKLREAGVERIDAVALGGIRDEAMLKRLATAGLARDGVVADGGMEPAALERRLTLATRSGIPVSIEGARWQWPTRLDGVQAGDEVLVYAEVPEGQPVRVSVGGRTGPELDLVKVERPLLERSWAKAKIDSLLASQGPDDQKADVTRAVIALSTAHRVLSPYTSLLVLETDADFARFHMDRKALADILTVDAGRLAVAKRKAPPGSRPAGAAQERLANAPPAAAPPARPGDARAERIARELARVQETPVGGTVSGVVSGALAGATAPVSTLDASSARGNMWGSDIGESYGAGGLGLTGVGEGGGGRGEGIGLGRVTAVGHGAGASATASATAGSGQGFGSGHGRLGGAHHVAPPTIRMGATQVSGRVPPEVIQRIVRQNFGRFRRCYLEGLARSPHLQGRVSVRFVIGRDGSVTASENAGSDLPDIRTIECVVRATTGLSFPAPDGGTITVTYPISFSNNESGSPPGTTPAPPPPAPVATNPPPPPPAPPKEPRKEPYTGRFKTVMDLVGAGGAKAAIENAFAWHREEPGDVMALVALGEALEKANEAKAATRVYGSIVDLFPARADMRRFAGQRLERLGEVGRAEALDTFAKAEEERPDHPESHRLVAFAHLREGDYPGAFAAAVRGKEQRYPGGRFRGVDQILREDLGLIAAAWIKAEPGRREEILAKLAEAGGTKEEEPSLRFLLSWETDANDVDFHIYDAEGGHAFYSSPELPSGGRLYADVTTGYGPECFTIRLPRDKRSEKYRMEANYYSRGPMGYGMGKLEIVDHDGKGGLTFEERPFVVMADGAFVDLGTVTR